MDYDFRGDFRYGKLSASSILSRQRDDNEPNREYGLKRNRTADSRSTQQIGEGRSERPQKRSKTNIPLA